MIEIAIDSPAASAKAGMHNSPKMKILLISMRLIIAVLADMATATCHEKIVVTTVFGLKTKYLREFALTFTPKCGRCLLGVRHGKVITIWAFCAG